jgi:predicted aldo/keto reductase-like oxidoreductase
MQTKAFDNHTLSLIGMGNMRLPTEGAQPGAPIDRVRAQEMIDAAMANGINYYDTAYVYHSGESEAFLGEALVSRYPRDRFALATKFHIGANPDYKAVFEEQLARLKTDYIDFYLLHAIFDSNAQTYLDSGAIAYFEEQKRLGRIRYFGFSLHASLDVLKQYVALRKWDFVQIQFNYFDWMYGSARQEYEILDAAGIPVLVMEPVRGGRLAALSPDAESILKAAHPDWSISSWALKWVRSHPRVQVVLSGMSTLAQVQDNVATFCDNTAWTQADEATLMKAAETFKQQVQVPCTACRYCCDDCPAKINIPAVLEVYNRYKLDGPWALRALDSLPSEGKPVDCIECGACTAHCPQNIQIKDIMHELALLAKP